MVHYLCGDNAFEARKNLNKLLADFFAQNPNSKLVKIEKKKLDLDKISNLLFGPSLFGTKLVFLIENFASFGPTQQEKLLKCLSRAQETMIFWDNKDTRLDQKIRSFFPQVKVTRYLQPKLIFKFLEAVFPGNQKEFIPLLEKITQKQPIELTFHLLKQHLKLLVTASINQELISHLPDWRKRKVISQARSFPNNSPVSLYAQLITLEYKNKTGKIPQGLYLALVNLLSTV